MIQKGFTLIELLVVIGIITILMAGVLIAVNPARQFASARDAGRRSDMIAITNSIYQYSVEHNGLLPASITTTPRHIGTNAGLVNLATDLVPTFIPAIPKDPSNGTDADTMYTLYKNASSRLVATAASELTPGTPISITR